MYRLSKRFRFEASHQLPQHDGKCARLHGHSWVAVVSVQGHQLGQDGPKAGMLMDFGDISAAMEPILRDHLDHWHLNESTGLKNPTSEELARWLYCRLFGKLAGLDSIMIEETCTSACEYRV